MSGTDQFKIGLKAFGPVTIQSFKYNELIRLQDMFQENMNQVEIVHKWGPVHSSNWFKL